MSKLRRTRSAFRPEMSQMEKLAGVSSLAVGGLACATFTLIEGPVIAASSPSAAATARGAGVDLQPAAGRDLAKSSTLGGSPPKIVLASSGNGAGTISSGAGQGRRDYALPLTSTAGTIRPLSLIPSLSSIVPPPHPTTLLTVAQPPSPPMNSAGSIGLNGASASPASGAGAAAQGAVPGGSQAAGPAQSQSGANSPAFLAPAAAAPSAAASNAPSGNRVGGVPLANQYVATPGSRASWGDAASQAGETNLSAGPNATTPVSALSKAATPSPTNGGAAASTPQSWTVTVNSAGGGASGGSGGGGGQTVYTGKLSFSGGAPTGPIYIGSYAGANFLNTGTNQAAQNATLTPTSTTWTVSGNAYNQSVAAAPYNGSSQVVPNPAVTNPDAAAGDPTPQPITATTTFQQQAFTQPASPSKSVSFVCPATPGVENVQVDVNFNIVVNSTVVGNGNATAKEHFSVLQPTLSGSIYYLKNPTYYAAPTYTPQISYSSPSNAKLPSGQILSGPVNGIDWSNVKVPTTQGTIAFEQLVTPNTQAFFSTAAAPYSYLYEYYNTATGTPVPAPFSTLDVSPKAGMPTSPFYPLTSDSPAVGIPNPNPYVKFYWSDNFTDYVMFQPTNNSKSIGIWVPEATFSWSITGTSTLAAGAWGTAGLTGTVSTFTVSHTAWPAAYNDLMYLYLGTKTV